MKGLNVCCCRCEICSDAGVIGHGLKLDDGLRKSTECLASISLDSALAPPSLDRASSQPNLVALAAEDSVSSSDIRSRSPSRSRAANDSGSTDRLAKVGGKEDGGDRERTRSEASATDKVAVIDKTLAKVMSGLKTIDALDQNTSASENVGGSSKSEDDSRPAAAISETVPIVVKMSTAREDRKDGLSSFASFSKKKSATLPKTGVEEMTADAADPQKKLSDPSLLNASDKDEPPSPRLQLSRSDSAPQRKDGPESVSFPSNVGHSRFEASSRAIPTATPVVPSGPPSVPPKPSKKPTLQGSPVISRPSSDGKTGGVGGKLGKK